MSRDPETVVVEVGDELARTFAALAESAEIVTEAITRLAKVWRESREEVST